MSTMFDGIIAGAAKFLGIKPEEMRAMAEDTTRNVKDVRDHIVTIDARLARIEHALNIASPSVPEVNGVKADAASHQ